MYGAADNGVSRTITDGIVTPSSLAFDKDGNLYVVNYYGNPEGITHGTNLGYIAVFAPGEGHPFLTIRKGIHAWNYSLAFDASENLYAESGCPNHNDPVSVYAHGNGSLMRTISQGVYFPCAIALDASGNLYVANLGSNTVSIFTQGGSQPSRTITDGVNRPNALAFDASGDLFVTNSYGGNDRRWGSVTIYPPGGSLPLRKITRGLNSGAPPYGSVLGPDGQLYVVDSPTRIVVYPKGGKSPDRVITQGLDGPTSLAFDRSGNLFVANCCSNTVTEYAAGTNKLIRTIPPAKGHPIALAFGPP